MGHRLLRFVCTIFLMLFMVSALWNSARAGEAVTYRLKWLRNMSTVGDIYAQAYKIFANNGLEVVIKPGGPEIDAIRELELGQAQFGVASADQVIRAVAKGAPVVVIAQLFQVNPLQWIYRPNRTDIRQPRDLIGKTVGVTFGKNDEIIMRTLLAGAHLRDGQVKLFSVRLDYTPFYTGIVDLWPVYINTQGVEIGNRLLAAGESIAFFDPNAHGVRFVANSLITSRRMMARDPETVRRFRKALLTGWRLALDPANARKAIQAVQVYDVDTRMEVLQEQLMRTRQLILPHADTVLGAIDHQAWQQTEAIMLTHHQIKRPVEIRKRLIEPGD
jgi:NitT/TauT family transport system substrate-binding protein